MSFNVGTQLTTINTPGLNIFHAAKETFPYTYAGWYNVSDRLKSYHIVLMNHQMLVLCQSNILS
jgi:hypothetical protein